jgi:tetratricopeptide (TPR) repeat protein
LDPETCYAEGEQLRLQGQYAEAERELRAAAEAAPARDLRARALAPLGDVLPVQGRYAEAERELRAAAEAAPARDLWTRARALASLGDVLRLQGRYAEAERELRAAAEVYRFPREGGVVLGSHWSDDLLVHIAISVSLGNVLSDQGEWESSRLCLEQARTALLNTLSLNRWPEAVGNLMATHGSLFETGLWVSEQGYRVDRSRLDLLWEGLAFADAAQCVVVREGLRRHARRGTEQKTRLLWQGARHDWHGLFTMLPSETQAVGEVSRSTVRGWRDPPPVAAADDAAPWPVELPGEWDDAKIEACRPVSRYELDRLLPDGITVVVVFFFQGVDLVVLPLRREPNHIDRCSKLRYTAQGYFRVPGVRAEIQRLSELQDEYIEAIDEEGYANLVAADLVRKLGPMSEIYQELYRHLNLDGLLTLIESDPEQLAKLHLVLIPDGPLYGLPLHAACSTASGTRLYQRVASLRYGLSLRTLDLQQQIQEDRAKVEVGNGLLRGVAFANPGQHGEIEPLPGVIREVKILVEETGHGSWWLHGNCGPLDQQAIRANLCQRLRAGNIGWIMAHGGEMPEEVVRADGRKEKCMVPSLLLVDGPMSINRLVAEGYDFSHWWLVNFSCCLLGRLEPMGASKEVMGYIATLTLLGSRRVASAMWRISDQAAPEFSRHWIRAIKKHVFDETPPSPHAFALAFREALEGFRQVDGGRFDHEYFWTPYTLYGLG